MVGPFFYAIHVNETFANFVRSRGLTTVTAIRGADPELEFPAGVLELKSAWQIVDDKAPPSNFIVTPARVPWLRVVNKQVEVDQSHPPRDVMVALLGLHVVFTLPCHPEFIWSTFEHTTNGVGDLAPLATTNPDHLTNSTVVSPDTFTLFHGGTHAGDANQALDPTNFDVVTQSFRSQSGPLQTSVYRAYPASKSNTTDEDDDVKSINKSVGSLLGSAADDRRGNYRLVGAVWLDRPDQSLVLRKALINDPSDPDIQTRGTDSPHSILGGEDGLSSMAMESFTQGFLPHCFTCHDARHVTRKGGLEIVGPKKLNVSHVFSKFVEDNTPQFVDGGR